MKIAGPVFKSTVAGSVPFDNSTNGFSSDNTQQAIEEVKGQLSSFGTPVSVGLTNSPGTATTLTRSDHVHQIDNLTYTSHSPRTTFTNTSAGINILTINSTYEHVANGTTSGFVYRLPDARTLVKGWKYEIYNRASIPISITYDDTTTLYQIASQGYAVVTLEDNSTNDGTWIVVASNLADIDLSNPDFTGVKDGFEDFMFDAYAGNGGNDNQYAFTVEANNGSSDIDGAVTVAGNDYEGIHILNSLAIANSRPLVHAFNGVNRIKLGAQPESFEIRVRIETLANITEKFTTRYGLMDISTIGLPSNGVFFSYQPTYPVTPVRQVVTATPNISSNAPTQNFIETINGTPYNYLHSIPMTATATPNTFTNAVRQIVTVTPDVTSRATTQNFTETINGTGYNYLHQVYQVITVTPNSFPTATSQQISVAAWTRTNNTLYTITINGTVCSYTSDASATDAEIATGLVAAINASAQSGNVLAAGSAKPFTVTSKILGTGFTYSGSANITTITLVTANVPKAVYTQTIDGTPYAFTSDGTPTATEVVTGLKALINADSGCPATATGTTTLILTDKPDPGDTFTYSGSANLTQADTTPFPDATTVCNGLRSLINADGPLPVTATGTTTLILTADVLGTAFTYSGTANLTNVLTAANVPLMQYTQTINGTNYVYTSDGTPTAAEVVAGLISLINADGPQPVTASGTTVLLMIGDVSGNAFTFSGSSNLTEVNTTATPNATTVCNGLRALIAADPLCVITGSGTTTLILTGSVNGAAFTYSGSANLTNVLTTPNTPEVLYRGNWYAQIANASSVTSLESGIPVVAGKWYRLKIVMAADATKAFFYIDSLFIGEINTPLPLAALRYVFKLEKTLGTTPRSTSIDYITWRRTRG